MTAADSVACESRRPFPALIKYYVLVNYNKPQSHLHSEDTSIQGTFALITRVSPEQKFVNAMLTVMFTLGSSRH